MSVKPAVAARPATLTFVLFLNQVAEKLNVQSVKLEELQEQLHNQTYMLKECVERLRTLGKKR